MSKKSSLPFVEKYRASDLSDIKGQDLAIKQTINFLKTFPKKKALILNGPVGTGKTSISIALANELNLELFELNASDLRNRKKLEEILKPATLQKSLFKKGKLILMDEADGITASDRGGLPELLALIDKTHYPIIITANDIWQRKFNLLRKKCTLVSLKELKENAIIGIINAVLDKENKRVKLETIRLLTKKARGDARAMLNDLQTIIAFGEDAFITDIGEREKEDSIFNALKKIFQNPADKDTVFSYDNISMNLDEILLWVEENIPLEYQGSALARAYDSLSKADIFKGRIYRQQYWRFLVYQNFFLSAGVAAATKLKSKRFTKYQKPTRVLKIWLANQKYLKKRNIATKYAKVVHISKKKALKESFLLPLILDKKTIAKLDLDDKEKQYLEERKEVILNSVKIKKLVK